MSVEPVAADYFCLTGAGTKKRDHSDSAGIFYVIGLFQVIWSNPA